MDREWIRMALGTAVVAAPLVFAGCGGGVSSASASAGTGTLPVTLSDASSEDWATIGVKVLAVALVPAGGGAPVTVYTAPVPAPVTNLVQLDDLAEILGIPSGVPAGAYSGAILTLGANPGDVALVVAGEPEAGFPGTPGAVIASDHIQVQNATGPAGGRTVTVPVRFAAPVTVSAGQNAPLDLEFDLAHPAFIVDHVPAAGSTFWAVNFRAPLRHHPVADIARLVLRHHYGTVQSVASDHASLTFTKDCPAYPATTPESAVATGIPVTVQADAANGTLFYDVDAQDGGTVLHDFGSLASTLVGRHVRVAARCQQDGTLVAVRIWAGSSFDRVWISPEGHVRHVDVSNPAVPVVTIENENAVGVPLTVTSATRIFFRAPGTPAADAAPITQDPVGFIAAGNLVRGFKVHASVVDPLASPLVAGTLDIELAKYDGLISAPGSTGFTYTRHFRLPADGDDYVKTLPYLSSTSANGKDASGNPIDGFKWWNFAFPTLADTGAGAIPDFIAATGGSVNFFSDPTLALKPWGVSSCRWNDAAAADAWAADWTVLLPVRVPLGQVATPWSAGAGGGSFGLAVPGGSNTVAVDLSSAAQSATLAYQVDRSALGIVTISPEDLTTASGLAAASTALGSAGTWVKAFGIPQANGHLKAYVLFYYTGTLPVH
jgi:hypothetical protein